MKDLLLSLCVSAAVAGLSGCTTKPSAQETHSAVSTPQPTVAVPRFDADSAYMYVARQLDFGPRVPGSSAQNEAAAWLSEELSRHGAEVTVQEGYVSAYDGTLLPIRNIIGSYNPEARRRILLIAHWDSRHIADQDADPTKRNRPVPAANDGASGVGVLLEIARQLGRQTPETGIDIFLTDAEDYGAPDSWQQPHKEEHWALGTQYWCRHPHKSNYQVSFGILLDMVGAADATFYKEYFSTQFAAGIVDNVWKTAGRLGHGQYFVNQTGGAITDDHYFINTLAGIPTIDIIDTRLNAESAFFPYWHTTEDTLDKISPQTLQAVGETLLHIIYTL